MGMEEQQSSRFRLMTYNIGGGRKGFDTNIVDVIEIVKALSPDILVVQQAVEYQNADDIWYSDVEQIGKKGEFADHFFFRTLSMTENIHVSKPVFVKGIFNDWQEWKIGNGILSRWHFVRLSDPTKPGQPRNVPLYQTPLYQ